MSSSCLYYALGLRQDQGDKHSKGGVKKARTWSEQKGWSWRIRQLALQCKPHYPTSKKNGTGGIYPGPALNLHAP